MSHPRPLAVVALIVVSLAVAVPRGGTDEGGCPTGSAGLKCQSKDVQKHACECDGVKTKGCAPATGGVWSRIRAAIQ